MEGRAEYIVKLDETDRTTLVQTWLAVLDAIWPAARDALVDGYVAWDPVPDEVALIERAFADRYGVRRAGIKLDLANEDDAATLRTFGPWSISADVFASDARPIVGVHDACLSYVRLTPVEMDSLASSVEDASLRVSLVPVAEWKSERREERRVRRRALVRRVIGRS